MLMLKNSMFLMSWKRQVQVPNGACENNDTRNNWKYVFTQWQTEKRIKGKDENVMMAYFKNVGAASAWS
jgi:hypothetical protein